MAATVDARNIPPDFACRMVKVVSPSMLLLRRREPEKELRGIGVATGGSEDPERVRRFAMVSGLDVAAGGPGSEE
jgi:hypothetical protein